MKIIADNKIPFLKGVLEPFCDIEYLQGNLISRNDLLNADALIIRTRTKCDASLLEGTKIKFIATATIGFDHIDIDYCNKNNIQWVNAPGCNSGSVQQWFMAALLQFAKKHSIDLTTRSLGVIGIGNVGSKIVSFAENIGMRVLLNDPPRAFNEGTCGFVNLDSIIREADIISTHVPLTFDGEYKTHHLINQKILQQMNTGAIMINSSRGEVVNTDALLQFANSGKCGGLILDVWENEPKIDMGLLNLANITTPHIAGYSLDGKANGTSMSVCALSKFFNLPLESWYPDDIPVPPFVEITIDAAKKSYQNVLTEAIFQTYDIEKESSLLKESPDNFEQFRSNYALRREPKAWTILIKNDNRNYKTRLGRLGFLVKEK